MYSRLIRYPKHKSFFLFGPRGTGKTTWVRAIFPDAVYIDLLESEIYIKLLANPQRIEELIPASFNDFIIVDEVQRVPELLNEIHRLIENKKYKFILTGSGARKLKRKGAANLLAGRALTLFMHPLTAQELGNDFNLKHSLMYGNLPCAYTENNPDMYLQSYIRTYLEQELRDEGISRNLSLFARFLEAASFSQGSVINYSEISRDCSVERKTVEKYFGLLEDLLIAHRVPVFSKKTKRRLISHPKFYFFDAGVFRAIRPKGPLDIPQEIQGVSLETLFLQELMSINEYLNLGYRIHYWRTSNNVEVDFILYGSRGIRAFEVKSTNRISGKMLRGIRQFISDYPMTKAYFVYGGTRILHIEGIEIIPLINAIKTLPQLLS